MRYYYVSVSNRNVFSRFLKVAREMSVDRRSCGREFHTTGP